MVTKSKLIGTAIITMLFFSLSVCLVAADLYTTEQTTNVTIGSDGTFTATQPDVGVSYQIAGTPNATGTVTADLYGGNPQATATVPSGVSLTSFIVLTFNMDPSDFTQATVTINYTSSEVQNINSPYTIYKYVSSSNSYTELPTTVNTDAKTLTVTLNSTTDPLLSIGGATKPTSTGTSTTTWILVAISIVLVIVAVVIVVKILRPSSTFEYGNKNEAESKTET
jgi:hypothetical protein